MSETVKQVLDAALTLSPADRTLVADALLASLDALDPALETAWKQEAEDRLAAYDAGLLEAVDAEDVLAEFDRP
jgi:putative addiction module component (TIGR02574 family)